MSRPRVFDWPPEREAELIARYRDGERYKLIAHALDLPEHAINTRIDRLLADGTLTPRNRPWLPADDRAVLSALAAGEGADAIARRIGRTRNAVRVHIHHLRRRQREALAASAALPFAAPPPSPAPTLPDRDQFTLELRAA